MNQKNQKKKENSSKIGRETNKKRPEQGGNGNKQGNSRERLKWKHTRKHQSEV
jgi:hypothetical protein